MAGSGIYASVLGAFQSQVVALSLSLDGNLVPVEIRKKLGTKDDSALVPAVRIVAEGREKNERLHHDTWWYTVDILVGLVAPGRLELAGLLTGELGSYLDWRESLANKLLKPATLGLSFVGHVAVDYKPVLDEQEIEDGMDVSAMSFAFRCLNDRP